MPKIEKKRKKITQEIILHFDCKSEYLVFDSLQTICLAMGTKSIAGNYAYYGIEKKGNEFYVALQTLVDRLEKKKKDFERLQETIHLMEQIVKAAMEEP